MRPTEINIIRAKGPDNLIIPPPAASSLTITTNGGNLALSWTPGPGSAGSLVVMTINQPPTGQPTNEVIYIANARFGSGQDRGGSNYVVYSNSGGSGRVSKLVPDVLYC